MPPKQDTTDWNSVETWERLIAAMVASGLKPDLNAVAGYYGTTYYTLQNRFRKINQDAKALKAAHGDGDEAAPPPKPTPRKPKTPKKEKEVGDTVSNGRITKQTPKKGSAKKATIKKEDVDNDELASSSDRDAPHVDDEDVFT